MKNLKFTPAYLVEAWGTEILKGFSSEIIEEKSCGFTSEKTIWTPDGKSFSFQNVAKSTAHTGVFLDIVQAENAVKYQTRKYEEYLKKEIYECTYKLNQLN